MIKGNVLETIGHTPVVRLDRKKWDVSPDILVKLEFFNPCGSMKDRIGVEMVAAAQKVCNPKKPLHIIEPTSGNTGIALAMVAAVRGCKLTITMPEIAANERTKILEFLGARVVLTDSALGMKGAIDKAYELARKSQNAIVLQQFSNRANVLAHEKTTAREIIEQTGGKLSAFVAGVGTGGTITGVGRVLKKEIGDHVQIIGVEPRESSVLSGGKPGIHGIPGLGAGFVPEILDVSLLDRVIPVSSKDAIDTMKQLARREGIIAGISSGAALWATLQVAKDFSGDDTIMCILPDGLERYLSIV